MLGWSTQPPEIYLYNQPVDMRKQFDGLLALVVSHYSLSQIRESGLIFAFINRRRTHMKVLCYQSGGYCLWYKRLEQGTFQRISGSDMVVLNSAQLQCLIDGIYWQKDKQNKRLR